MRFTSKLLPSFMHKKHVLSVLIMLILPACNNPHGTNDFNKPRNAFAFMQERCCKLLSPLLTITTSCQDSLSIVHPTLCLPEDEAPELLRQPRSLKLLFLQDAYTELYHYKMVKAFVALAGENDTLNATIHFYVPMDFHKVVADPNLALPGHLSVYDKSEKLILEASPCLTTPGF
jgi:hypothetical protein